MYICLVVFTSFCFCLQKSPAKFTYCFHLFVQILLENSSMCQVHVAGQWSVPIQGNIYTLYANKCSICFFHP